MEAGPGRRRSTPTARRRRHRRRSRAPRWWSAAAAGDVRGTGRRRARPRRRCAGCSPTLPRGVIGGLDDPEVDPAVEGHLAAPPGDRVGVLVGGVPQRVQQLSAERRRGGAVVGLGGIHPTLPSRRYRMTWWVGARPAGRPGCRTSRRRRPAGPGRHRRRASAPAAVLGLDLGVADPDRAAGAGRDQHRAVAVGDDPARALRRGPTRADPGVLDVVRCAS